MTHRAWVLAATLGLGAGCGGEENKASSPTVDGVQLPVPNPELSYPGAWVQQASGTEEDLVAIDAIDENRAWIADAAGTVYRTLDGGETWVSTGEFPRHSTSPNSPTWVYQLEFIDELHGWARSTYLLMSTSDGGVTWTKRQEALPHNFGKRYWSWMSTPVFQSLSFISPTEGWVVTNMSTSHTTDGGETWTGVDFSAEDLKFIDSQTGWRTYLRKLYKTVDKGQTWQLHGTVDQDHVHDLSAVDEAHAWVLADGHVYGTYGAHDWIVRPTEGAGDIQFVDAAHGWAVGKKIRHSSDGGDTWWVQTTPQSGFTGVDFVNSSVGWVVGVGGVILKTETGGK